MNRPSPTAAKTAALKRARQYLRLRRQYQSDAELARVLGLSRQRVAQILGRVR